METQSAIESMPSHSENLPVDGDQLRNQTISRFVERTPKSKQYAEDHRPHHADKSSIGGGFDALYKEASYPLVIEQAQGAKISDIDGNHYIDILQGLGANLFGHNPTFVREAIEKQLAEGMPIGTQHPKVGELAKLITDVTGNERACFSNTGTEAVMAAIRLARTVNKRDCIAVFTNSYHGHSDNVLMRAPLAEYARRKLGRLAEQRRWLAPLAGLMKKPIGTHGAPAAPGIPASIARNVLVLDYGNPASLDVIRSHRKRLAAVLVEPVQSRFPELQPVDFLRELRDLTSKLDIALIFDEMVTGFRLHPAGAQGLFDIRADIATYSKIAGGGMPLSVVAGKSRYLDAIDGGQWHFGDDSSPQTATTFFAGTFCKHPLSVTAAHAMLTQIKEEGPALQETLTQRTRELVNRLNSYTEQHDLPLRYTHSGSFFAIAMSESHINPVTVTLLSYLLLCENIYLRPGDKGGFLTKAHDEQDIKNIAASFEKGLSMLRHAGQL